MGGRACVASACSVLLTVGVLLIICCLLPGVSGRDAYVTFVASDEYAVGALTLGASLRASGTRKEMVAITLKELSPNIRAKMKQEGWQLVIVPSFPNPFGDDHVTFTKIALWSLLAYDRAVFLDADCVVRMNIDEVFNCGQVLCAGMGRHHSRKFDFDLGLLVLHPSKETFEELLSTAAHLDKVTGPDAEFNFLNSYFLHRCKSPVAPPSSYGPSQYEPPVWNHASADRLKDQCYQLDATYNWQWGSDSNDTLLGTEKFGSDFHPDVRVLHFAGKNVKPWHWKKYPLHGWIVLWHSFASQVPGLIPVSSYILYVMVPLAVVLAAFLAALLSATDAYFPIPLLVRSSDWSLWLFLAQAKPVLSKYLSIWLLGGVPLIAIPVSLYYWDLILPPILPPLVGWSLFFVWASLLYWAVYGPYVLYHYHLGRAFAAPSVATSTVGQRKATDQLRWLRRTPSYVPKQTSVFMACILHSVGFSVLGFVLVLLQASLLAWSSPLLHLVFACLYGLVFLVHFAYWGAGLPRHALLTGFRSHAPSGTGHRAIGIALANVEAGSSATSKRD